MSGPRQARRGRRILTSGEGFTIVELVLAMVILASLAAVSAPRFFRAGAFSERFFNDEAHTALRYAHKLAVATGCDVQVLIAANSYTLAQRGGCTGPIFDQPVAHPGTGAASYQGQAPSGIGLSSDISPFVFDALGRATTPAGVVTDVSVSVGGRALSIVGETGFVHVP